MEKCEAEGEVFNVGTGNPTSISSLAEIIRELCAADSSISYEVPRVGDIRDSYADISKTEKILGYTPKCSLTDGLKDMVSVKDFQMEQPP